MAYTTKQRVKLARFLEAHKTAHITMREILDFARQEEIGTATVYRYLDSLVQEGKLSKFNTDAREDGACFQWLDAQGAFYHFVCNDCGKCFHVDCPELSALDTHISKEHGFEVNLTKTVFRGRCAACVGKENV